MIQDSSQTDESPSSTRSDLVEVVCEPTDDKVKSSTTQDQSLSYEWYEYRTLKKVAPVPVVTESEAGRLLAARIPPELFDDILFFVNVDRVAQREEYNRNNGNYLTRNRGEPSPEDVLTDLKQCSLVCLFWANRCREHMFSDRTLVINSYEDAEIFRRYVVGGCPRLMPVHQLISKIVVYQHYKSGRSFLHLLFLPAIRDKFARLSIDGPVPESFKPAKLDTPHWSIPPCIVAPSSFLLNMTVLKNIHLPSFHHVTKYIRHFTCASEIWFEKITWDGQMDLSLPHASSTITCQRRPHSLTINAWGGCTNSVHLALTAVMMNPNCPLHRLSDEERVWMITFMTLLWGHEKGTLVEMRFDVSEQTTTMRLSQFQYVFEGAPPTDRSASALSVVGMCVYIDGRGWGKLPANFDALVNHARTHPAIRALVLLFESFADLQLSVRPFVEVLSLAADTIKIVLAYEKEEECQAVGVDLVTLEQNGRVHTWADEQSEDFGGRAVSLQMLQRQLKKKRWMTVH
ncbi:hypothetical protein BC629DRAFT_1737943 [Irpex lacteus]|nr:hypothetical protein BC629DRAFT_1737943 [Irpex lacteus]